MAERIRPEYRIRPNFVRPTRERYAAFQDLPTATISDVFRKRQTLPVNIKPLWPACPKLVGPALTILATPGDEILALKALELAQPGDVVVVSGAYSDVSALWGGLMSTTAKMRGIAGLVTDSLVRDIDEVRELDFPIYCVGHIPTAPVLDSPPGDLGLPIPLGRVIINPGDLIVADETGVVVVPQDELEAVAAAVQERVQWEADRKRAIVEQKRVMSAEKVQSCLARREVQYLEE